MQSFKYKAVDKNGRRREGILQVPTIDQAASLLREEGLLVTFLGPVSKVNIFKALDFRRGVPLGDKVLFTRQLSVMINAGLPIAQALKILQKQSRNPIMAEALEEIVNAIDGGSSLHAAMEQHPRVFNRLYVSLVRAGEASGQLDTILNRLADSMEEESKFKSEVRGAMIYPIIIILVMSAVISLMFIFVIPRLSTVYRELDAELPLITRVLLGVSDAFTSFWWLMVLLVLVLVVGSRIYSQTSRGRYSFDSLKFKLPVFGGLGKEIQLTNFTRTLALLVTASVPILEALEIAKDTLSNIFLREAVDEARSQVEQGHSLAEPLRNQTIFPPLLGEMVAVGEQTGKIAEVLQKVADYLQSDSNNQVKNLTAALEPLIMVGLGISVGVLVIALLLPVYSLTSKF